MLIEAADGIGARTVLTGLGSDEILDASPYHLADLVRDGRWLAAWREAVAWAEARNDGVGTVLADYVLGPLLWPWSPTGRLRGSSGVPPWVRRDFVRKTGMPRCGPRRAPRPRGVSTALALSLEALGNAPGDWSRWHLAAPRGLNITHPFRDPRLVAFALGIPPHLKSAPGVRKPVLQAALRGILPEPIRTRREKRGFNDVYWRGLARSLPRLEAMVGSSGLAEMGILEAQPLIDALRRTAHGVGGVRESARLNQALSLVAWFEQATTAPRSRVVAPDWMSVVHG